MPGEKRPEEGAGQKRVEKGDNGRGGVKVTRQRWRERDGMKVTRQRWRERDGTIPGLKALVEGGELLVFFDASGEFGVGGELVGGAGEFAGVVAGGGD